MLFTESYLTLKENAEAIFRDRGSSFHAYALKAENPEEISENIARLKKLHPSARHYCFAWRLGADHSLWRANDDGEPAGSAGKPILNQIQSHQLTNVLIVVVRYFGGTLLGVSGLINAYKEASAMAIANAGTEERHICFEYDLEFDNEDTGKVMRLLKDCGAEITRHEYHSKNLISFTVKKAASAVLEDKLREVYKAQLKFTRMTT